MSHSDRGQHVPRGGGGRGRRGGPPSRFSFRNRSGHYDSNTSGVRAEWKSWDKVCLRLKNVPNNATTSDIWSHFADYGNLVSVELFEAYNGARDGSGRIRFSPPPTKDWNDNKTIKIQGREVQVSVSLEQDRPAPRIQAPSGRTYPPVITLGMNALQFGVLAHENKMMPLRTISNNWKGRFFLAADLKFKCFEIAFACHIKDPRREDNTIRHHSRIGEMEHTVEYKTQIPFTHLKKVVFIDVDEHSWALLIHLPTPPIFYKKTDIAGSHSNGKNSWNERDAWTRAVDITYDTTWFKDDPVSLPRANQFVDIGRWTTYRLVFAKSTLEGWNLMKLALQDFNIAVDHTTSKDFPTVPAVAANLWELLEPAKPCTTGLGANLALLVSTKDVHLPYDVRYQLEVCISQGIFNEVSITAEFLGKLAELSSGRTRRRDRAKDLLTYISQPRVGSRAEDKGKLDEKRIYEPMSLFNDKKALSYYPELSIPEHCQWVRKVVVTPTTMHLSSPMPEPSNRVLRQFVNYEDRFLRVQFTDELTKGRIFPSPGSVQENALFNRVHRTLQNGIRIGGRHFEYLATGNSQFRENGAYFFCPTDFLTCDNIRGWMGDVTHIRVVAKYAARLGQCFSTTRVPKASPIGQTIKQIEDINNGRWCFTDGVGKIAPSRARFLMQNLNMNKNLKHVPSVFQFRLGGSKGVLVEWPDVPFNEVHLRPSQNKFIAATKNLEVIKTSRFSNATLNRQTIIILSCLGVPDSVFEDMMRNQVASYARAMEDPQEAMKLLSKFVDQNGVTTTIAQMVADGFMKTEEPFAMAILQVWHAWSMRLLREKARLVVEQGAFVFGCVDETRTLRGHYESPKSESDDPRDPSKLPQIFLQVPKTRDKPGEGEYAVVTGICLLGRNPSLHPGDIRVVEAVDVPALRHLRDVVVFPAVGDRDIPSMCSGGDLDGDDYFVIWDPQLIPAEWNYPPMSHDGVTPKQLKRDVKVSDLISFFVRYMKNDSLSTIAHAHLAKCDALHDGPKDPQCIELAHLHSNAVDYPKTGEEAHLSPWLRPRRFPHFMEKPPHKTYRSHKILGKLYDSVAKIEFKPKLDGAFDERILRRYKLDSETLKTMRMVKRQHDKAVRQIMNQHDIETEFEVWSTFVLSRPRVGSEYKRQEKMEPVVADHRDRFRNACIKVAGSREPSALYRVVAAAYQVTWEEVQRAQEKLPQSDDASTEPSLTGEKMPLISFPWIFEHELGRMATSQTEFELDEIPKLATLMDGEGDDDDDEFERLVGAGLIEGEEAATIIDLASTSMLVGGRDGGALGG